MGIEGVSRRDAERIACAAADLSPIGCYCMDSVLCGGKIGKEVGFSAAGAGKVAVLVDSASRVDRRCARLPMLGHEKHVVN